MEYNPKFVSVIIPTYNGGIQIKETLDSVLNQTHEN
jgi:glycosyltransferase involved in cell wall biosynthesis